MNKTIVRIGGALGVAAATIGVPVLTAAPASAATCPTNANDIITNRTFKVEGDPTVYYGLGDSTYAIAKPGDKITAFFTVAEGCSDVQVGLAVYELSRFDEPIDEKQNLQETKPASAHAQDGKLRFTTTYGAGTYSVGPISTPSCDYQIDFFTGYVIEKFNIENGETYSSQQRLLAAGRQDGADCVPAATTTTTVAASTTSTTKVNPTTTTTADSTTTTTIAATTTTTVAAATTTTTEAAAVLGNSVERATPASPAVAASALPRTGQNTDGLIQVGAIAVGLGGLLFGTGAWRKRRLAKG